MQTVNRGTDFTDGIKEWWNNCPLFNRTIIGISIAIYLISFFFEAIFYYLANIPMLTIFHF